VNEKTFGSTLKQLRKSRGRYVACAGKFVCATCGFGKNTLYENSDGRLVEIEEPYMKKPDAKFIGATFFAEPAA
jgi:hypothetical protein